jgi:hypothetical protein
MGGAVEESVAGLADIIEASRPSGHRFVDYRGAELPWQGAGFVYLNMPVESATASCRTVDSI